MLISMKTEPSSPLYHGRLEYEVNGCEDFGILGSGKKVVENE